MLKSTILPALLSIALGCAAKPTASVCPEIWNEPVGAPAAGTPDTRPAADSQVVLDDLRAIMHLQTEASKLIGSGQTTKMSMLQKQARSARCRLALPSAGAQAMPGERIYENARPGALIVGNIYKCDKCQNWHVMPASGFVISASGACVTNYHLLEVPRSETLVAMTADGRTLAVKSVLAASKADDVAILQLEGEGFRPLPMKANAPVGARVRVISHPDGRLYTLSEGIISRYYTVRDGAGTSPRMSITADYARGSSGGPVLDDRGAVVGMVSSTFSIYYNEQNGHKENLQMVVKQCIPAGSILKLIQP